MKKIIGYVRCSTTKQDLESQKFVLRAWGAKNSKEIILIEDFAVSGKKDYREGLETLLKLCRSGEVSEVIVVEISRLGRSIDMIYKMVKELSDLKIKIILANTGTILDYNSLEGRALIGGLALAADIEWMLISERNKRGREKIKREKIKVGRKRAEERGINLNAVLEFKEQGKGIREIARLLNTSAPTILRMMKRYEDAHQRNVTESNQNGQETAQNVGGVTFNGI